MCISACAFRSHQCLDTKARMLYTRIRVFKIMITLSRSACNCQVIENNNDLLTKDETIDQLIHTNQAYARILYTRMCVYVYAYVRICIRVCAYWADAYYAYILVRIVLSCTVWGTYVTYRALSSPKGATFVTLDFSANFDN